MIPDRALEASVRDALAAKAAAVPIQMLPAPVPPTRWQRWRARWRAACRALTSP